MPAPVTTLASVDEPPARCGCGSMAPVELDAAVAPVDDMAAAVDDVAMPVDGVVAPEDDTPPLDELDDDIAAAPVEEEEDALHATSCSTRNCMAAVKSARHETDRERHQRNTTHGTDVLGVPCTGCCVARACALLVVLCSMCCVSCIAVLV